MISFRQAPDYFHKLYEDSAHDIAIFMYICNLLVKFVKPMPS